MPLFSKLMMHMGLVERRKDGRIPGPSLEVFYGEGEQQRAAQIRDISATGISLVVPEPMEPGTSTFVTLKKNTTGSVRLWARVVRQDKQEVALTFVPTDFDHDQWLNLMGTAAKLAGNDAIARFRIARAFSFLARIAAPVQDEIAEQMVHFMSSERRERLLAIVLSAEEQLERENRRIRTGISTKLIRDILQFGSSAEDNLTQTCWSQLLASSCLPVYRDDESQRLVDILSNLLPVHLNIFSSACELTIGGGRWSETGELDCTLEEIREIAHTPNLNVIDQYLLHLCELGLLERTMRPRKGEQIKHANLTVTMLGVEFYARCWRQENSKNATKEAAASPEGLEGFSIPQQDSPDAGIFGAGLSSKGNGS